MNKKTLLICITSVILAIVAVSAVLASKYHKQYMPAEILTEVSETETTTVQETVKNYDYRALALSLSRMPDREVSIDLLEKLDSEMLEQLEDASASGAPSDEKWHEITGYTYNALVDKYITGESIDMGCNGKDSFVLGFTGDINFTPNGYVMTHARNKPNVVLDCIDETYQSEMKAADIMLVNNEFPYSDRGSPLQGKKYTFRADPDTVKYMTALGVDVVSLANNHAYDYGYDSFIDTIKTLEDEGIPYVGAGMNASEAATPVTFLINGYKVGYLASSGVEWPIWTPVAENDSPGIMGTYDEGAAMISAIRNAKGFCDYVIAYPHWGYENTTSLSAAQNNLGKAFIDAGADAVVGNHSHCLQGIEFYKGAPIIYSLGNFWFNTRSVYTAMAKLTVSGQGIELSYVPGWQSGSETYVISDPSEQRVLYNKIISWSPKPIAIDDNGVITEK